MREFEDDGKPPPRRSRRDLVWQLVGFAVGIALLWWCVRAALMKEGATATWNAIVGAPRPLIAVMLVATLVSLAANGTLFWSLIRPVRPRPLGELQLVNLVASVLNYAPLPLRLGLVARVAYHWRVDRMPALVIAAWMLAAMLATGSVLAGIGIAMLIAPSLWMLIGLALVGACAAAVSVAILFRLPWIARRARGAEAMVTHADAFGPAVLCRTVDVAAWAVRMICAAKILEVPVTTAQAAALGIVAVAASFNPLGRFGFREAAVAFLASRFLSGAMSGTELDATFARLAVVESLSEGAVTIPLGAIALAWWWRRMRRAGRRDQVDDVAR